MDSPTINLRRAGSKRRASFVIRFSNKNKYRDAVNLYYQVFGLEDAPGSTGPLIDSYSIAMRPGEDVELRLVWKDKSKSAKRDIAVEYWELDKRNPTHEDLVNAHSELLRNYPRLRSVDEPTRDAGLTKDGLPTESSLLYSPDGDYEFGLIINPPFPRGKRLHKKKLHRPSNLFLPAISIAMGTLVLGTIWFFRKADR